MLNKKITQCENERTCVKYILRGAKRRRAKALEAVRAINSEAGIRANLYAVR